MRRIGILNILFISGFFLMGMRIDEGLHQSLLNILSDEIKKDILEHKRIKEDIDFFSKLLFNKPLHDCVKDILGHMENKKNKNQDDLKMMQFLKMYLKNAT